MGKISDIFNFDNIGGKIKALAKWSCWITILLIWIAAPIAFIAAVADDYTVNFCWIPLVGAAILPVIVWIGSWGLYAFGQFVEDTHAARTPTQPTELEQEAPRREEPTQEAPRREEPTQEAPAIIDKRTKIFSILAGAFFIITGLMRLLQGIQEIAFGIYLETGDMIGLSSLHSFSPEFPHPMPYFILALASILLGVFIILRNKKGVTALLVTFAVGYLLAIAAEEFFHFYIFWVTPLWYIFEVAFYLLLMLISIFRKKLLNNPIMRIAVFLIPIAYTCLYFRSVLWSVLRLSITVGTIFYLIYLIYAVKKETAPATDEV